MTYKWRLVGVLFFTAALNYADRTAISAVFPLIRAEFGLSDLELALLGTSFLWTYASCAPFAGYLADRMDRSRLIVGGLALWSAVTLAAGLVTSFPQMIATRILLGVTESLYFPSAIALIAGEHDFDTRATANGIHLAGLNIGLVAGGTLSGYLGERFGWRVTFLVLGTVGLLLAAAALRLIRPERKKPHETALPGSGVRPIRAIIGVWSKAQYRYVVCTSMTVAAGVWIFFNWLPLYLDESHGFSLASAGFFGTFLMQAPAVAGVAAGGLLSDRYAHGETLRRMKLQSFCYLASAPFLFLADAAFAPVAAALFLFALFRGMGGANEDILTCEFLPQRLRSTVLGLLNTANCAAGGLAVLLAGYAKQRLGLAAIFAGVSCLVLAASAVAWTGYRRTKETECATTKPY
jgi:predicted MFS family arabinose efflux permease